MTNDTENGQETSRGGKRRYFSRPRFCQFCADKTLVIDYKNIEILQSYINREGKIRPRRQTGTCAKHQRKISSEIKKARHMALLPFSGEALQ